MNGSKALRVLVTGAGGFIGRHVIEAFRNYDVDIVSVSANGREGMLSCNLLDCSGAERLIRNVRPTHLLHLAWHDHPQKRWSAAENIDWVAASLHLARAFSKFDGRRLVFAGSAAQYSWRSERITEDSVQDPSSLYGAAKSATERALYAASAALGCSIATARIFYCYGAGEPSGRLVRDLIDDISAGREARCTDGKQKRDYLYAVDLGAALARVTLGEITGGINVASGAAIPVRMLIEEVARQLGRPELIQYGALARRHDDPPVVEADVSKLKALGFSPRFDLRSGVEDMLRRISR